MLILSFNGAFCFGRTITNFLILSFKVPTCGDAQAWDCLWTKIIVKASGSEHPYVPFRKSPASAR